MASYELAYRQGVDHVDVDLVPTRDRQLIARHENEIGCTTDVADHSEFTDRKTTKVIDGTALTGWFAEDFTLAEIKTLRATERIPDIRQRNTVYNGLYKIPTYEEVLDLVEDLSSRLRRKLGTLPEIKHSTYFQSIGNPIEPTLIDLLNKRGLNRQDAPIAIQSFEVTNLKSLREQVAVQLFQLIEATGAPSDLIAAGDPRTYADLLSEDGLAEVSTYADYLGPEKNQIIARDGFGNLGGPTTLIRRAHAAGLRVVGYTFRGENSFLPANLRSSDAPNKWGDIFAEYRAFFAAGIDGVFADQPDTVLEATKADDAPS